MPQNAGSVTFAIVGQGWRLAPSVSPCCRTHHVLRTKDMLRLVQQRLGIGVDTYDAVSWNPRR